MDKEKKHPDLTHVGGTFAKAVEENANILKELIEDETVDVNELRDFVFEMMDSCKATPWIRKTKYRMSTIKDKNELSFYIYNAMLSGANLKAA